MSLDEFYASTRRNDNIKIGIFDIYVRKAYRIINDRVVMCLDIGNVQNWSYKKRGKGYFRDLIKALAKTETKRFGAIYIENVANERLAKSLPSMGFTKFPDMFQLEPEMAPSFYMLLTTEHMDHGSGDEEHGPEDTDCGCRGSDKQQECALSGCGFCRAATKVLIPGGLPTTL